MINSDKFYVRVDIKGSYNFYYNMEAAVNDNIERVLGWHNFARLEMTRHGYEAYRKNIEKFGRLPARGDTSLGVIGSFDTMSEDIELYLATNMLGIVAEVNKDLAVEILELAKFYCPVDTGTLKKSGVIEPQPDGSVIIKFDTPYAWYVHEFYWKAHKFPTRAFFLTDAIEDVYRRHGLKYEKRKLY